MNLNLSKSELNLLLSQLQQRLTELSKYFDPALKMAHDQVLLPLDTNGDDQGEPVDLSKRTTKNSLKNQSKSTSMFNLDLIDNV